MIFSSPAPFKLTRARNVLIFPVSRILSFHVAAISPCASRSGVLNWRAQERLILFLGDALQAASHLGLACRAAFCICSVPSVAASHLGICLACSSKEVFFFTQVTIRHETKQSGSRQYAMHFWELQVSIKHSIPGNVSLTL
jgi:hypothetical protein